MHEVGSTATLYLGMVYGEKLSLWAMVYVALLIIRINISNLIVFICDGISMFNGLSKLRADLNFDLAVARDRSYVWVHISTICMLIILPSTDSDNCLRPIAESKTSLAPCSKHYSTDSNATHRTGYLFSTGG